MAAQVRNASRTADWNCRLETGLNGTAVGWSRSMRAIVSGSRDPVMKMTRDCRVS